MKQQRKRNITRRTLEAFRLHLLQEEKSSLTVGKYLRDARAFMAFAAGRSVDKALVAAYKQRLLEQGYAARSVNSMLAGLNSLFGFLGCQDCRVRNVRVQRRIYCAEERELTKAEYLRLLEAARRDRRLYLLLETICGTGIRVSELAYFTVEAVAQGEIAVRCKNKTRSILIPGRLRKSLLAYARQSGIASGPVFRTRSGRAMDRSGVWAQMKALCAPARVRKTKVFPHNLRKLFARTFYAVEKDIAKLADILGHSSIDTTRIYIMTSGHEHRRKIDRLGLVV